MAEKLDEKELTTLKARLRKALSLKDDAEVPRSTLDLCERTVAVAKTLGCSAWGLMPGIIALAVAISTPAPAIKAVEETKPETAKKSRWGKKAKKE